MKKIGIYGGSFSPPHNGHIGAARAFLSEIALDTLLIMPANIPPHKTPDPRVSPRHRFELAKLAFSHLPSTVVSDYEINRQGVSYTADTLTHFAQEGELYFLCGTDMFLSLPHWRHPEVIFEKATVVLAKRDNVFDKEIEAARQSYVQNYGAKITVLHNLVLPLSSTEIRNALAEGKDVSAYIPKSVEDYIHEHGLYDAKQS